MPSRHLQTRTLDFVWNSFSLIWSLLRVGVTIGFWRVYLRFGINWAQWSQLDCGHIPIWVGRYVCMYVCTYVCMYVCTYVCMYVCIYTYRIICVYIIYTCDHHRPSSRYVTREVWMRPNVSGKRRRVNHAMVPKENPTIPIYVRRLHNNIT